MNQYTTEIINAAEELVLSFEHETRCDQNVDFKSKIYFSLLNDEDSRPSDLETAYQNYDWANMYHSVAKSRYLQAIRDFKEWTNHLFAIRDTKPADLLEQAFEILNNK
jgi:hypothetical protein